MTRHNITIILTLILYCLILNVSSINSIKINNNNNIRNKIINSELNGKIWHITDVHYDWNYVAGGNPKNMCHSNSKKSKSTNNNNISKNIKFNINNLIDEFEEDDEFEIRDFKKEQIASSVGNYNCDSPIELVESAFREMVEIEPNPDFIIWTGDDPPHVGTSELNETLVLQSVLNMTNYILDYFPNTPVYPAIGNHDSYPQHQIAVGPNWLLEGVADMWTMWLTNDSLSTFRKGGYYTELVQDGMRIISLNTVYYYTQDNQCLNLTDPAGQFQWLNQTLLAAREANELVWIIGHVPPGHNEKYNVANMHPQFNDAFLYAFSNYSDIIVTHIYGHEHTDSFRLYYDEPHKIITPHHQDWVPQGVMFLSPSITPWMDPYIPALPNNPSIRIYHYNTTSYGLLDYDQYWSNLTANIESGEINWMLEYRATTFYNVRALDPLSMYQAFLLLNSDTDMLNTYHFYNSVSYPTHDCDLVCKKIQLCTIQHLFNKGFGECLITGANFFLKK